MPAMEKSDNALPAKLILLVCAIALVAPSFLGGEGMVCRFNGQGTVWSQSHNPPSFGKQLGPMLPER